MSIKYDKYMPLYTYLSPASIPQIVAHIQDYLVKHPILSVETIAEIIVQSLQEHPELINGTAIPISADSEQSIKAYIDSLPSVDTYTKAEINLLLTGKQDTLTFDQAPTPGSSNPVTSSGIIAAMSAMNEALETLINAKADSVSTYTKTQVDTLLTDKANAADVYSKNTMDAKLLEYATSDSVYSKQDINTMKQVNKANLAIVSTDGMAPLDIAAGQYVYFNDVMYMATEEILTGVQLVPNANIVINPIGVTNRIGDGLKNAVTQINGLAETVSNQSRQIGDLTTLQTTVKTDLVSAVNENKNAIDTCAKLFTTQLLYVASAGYITGSGNYFDFFIPLACDPSKTYTITNVDNVGFFMADGKHTYAFDTFTIVQKSTNGLFVDLHFTATQTPNQLGLFRGDLTITVQ